MILAIHHEDVYRRLRESARHRETAEPGSHYDDALVEGLIGEIEGPEVDREDALRPHVAASSGVRCHGSIMVAGR